MASPIINYFVYASTKNGTEELIFPLEALKTTLEALTSGTRVVSLQNDLTGSLRKEEMHIQDFWYIRGTYTRNSLPKEHVLYKIADLKDQDLIVRAVCKRELCTSNGKSTHHDTLIINDYVNRTLNTIEE